MKSSEGVQIDNYGVVLQKLTKEDIELVRNWRNDPKISKHMFFRDYITTEMQQSWFESVNFSGTDFYFIIKHNESKVGMANIKNVSWSDKTGEAGMFIYDDRYIGSIFPFQVSCCLMDFAFYGLGLDSLIAHILKVNRPAIRQSVRLGYKMVENQEGIENKKYILSKVSYEINVITLKHLILKTLGMQQETQANMT